jgi:hypothetical protein
MPQAVVIAAPGWSGNRAGQRHSANAGITALHAQHSSRIGEEAHAAVLATIPCVPSVGCDSLPTTVQPSTVNRQHLMATVDGDSHHKFLEAPAGRWCVVFGYELSPANGANSPTSPAKKSTTCSVGGASDRAGGPRRNGVSRRICATAAVSIGRVLVRRWAPPIRGSPNAGFHGAGDAAARRAS